MGDLSVKLNYCRDEGPGGRPYLYTYERSPEEMAESVHKKQNGGGRVNVEVVVRDGRACEDELRLDTHSFQLEKGVETKLSTEDFYSNEIKVKDVYYKEMEELLKKATGAERVIMIHHQVRNKERCTATKDSGTTNAVGPYAAGIHGDSHPYSAKELFRMVAGGMDKKYHSGRFLYVNAWRNISDCPIGNDHLAVCDETSLVKPDDYIVSDLFDKVYSLQQYSLVDDNAAGHRWYYFSRLKKDEVILFKQWDSDTTLTGRVCFHTAFHDDNAPACPSRQSIEARGIAFFPDHKPNTCPSMMKKPEYAE